MEHLPEDCLSMVLSFMSPREACQLSAISNTFHHAVESELLWEKFLPSDYKDIILRGSSAISFSFTSKKDLFLRLSDHPLLIDDGTKTFSIDKYRNKKCYMLSARELSIAWGSDPLSWCWKPFYPNSRFKEVAELVMTTWLEIHGKICTRMLSPNTRYGAYLVIKLSKRAYGLDLFPAMVSIEVGSYRSIGHAYLQCRQKGTDVVTEGTIRSERILHERKDGWEEIELGEFNIGDASDEKEVNMRLREVEFQVKAGIVVEGIEIRPKF